MFVTKSQFYIFIACIAFGGTIGVVFSIFSILKFFAKNKIIKIFSDVIAFSVVGVIFPVFSHYMNFSNVRLYMLVGILMGIYLYFKSFHILLAKYAKKFYNIIVKINKKRAKDDRKQIQKINSSLNNRGSNTNGNISYGNDISTNFHKSSSG